MSPVISHTERLRKCEGQHLRRRVEFEEMRFQVDLLRACVNGWMVAEATEEVRGRDGSELPFRETCKVRR